MRNLNPGDVVKIYDDPLTCESEPERGILVSKDTTRVYHNDALEYWEVDLYGVRKCVVVNREHA